MKLGTIRLPFPYDAAELAVERYGNKQVVINLKTGQALGLKIDSSMLRGAQIIQ
jgi:hypothetical protein